MKNNIKDYYSSKQGRLPLFITDFLDSCDSVLIILSEYASLCHVDEKKFVSGRGHRKSPEQRYYEKLKEYTSKLREYVGKIRICGSECNSYSKTDHGATFMRMKKDYMGNDR